MCSGRSLARICHACLRLQKKTCALGAFGNQKLEYKEGVCMDFEIMRLIDDIKVAGVVGEGGAGFPTHVKLNTSAQCYIINIAECEPLIETDKYLCRNFSHRIVKTIATIAKSIGAERIVIAIKKKYVAEISALAGAITEYKSDIEIFTMDSYYPAGDEQTIVQQVCGVSVPERGIPLDVGAVVNNVGTILKIADALEGLPVTQKYLSVVGEVKTNVMVRAPLGTPIIECIKAAQPNLKEYAVILGGSMMGKVLTGHDIDTSYVTKTTGNIIVLPTEHYLIRLPEVPISRIWQRAKSVCIQCRMCTDLCPRHMIGHQIRPHLMMRNFFREPNMDDNSEYCKTFGDAANCCDCGACELFSCPMGLSPRRVNMYLKEQLRNRKIEVEKNQTPTARENVIFHKIPSTRLIRRLGLSQYYGEELREGCTEITPGSVRISMAQHIGKPASLIKKAGDKVEKGELIGSAVKNGLSANIHASITGLITSCSDGFVEIQMEKR